MTPELEAMAKAIYNATAAKWSGLPWEEAEHTEHLRQARAALVAIRAPTDAMVMAALPLLPDSVARPDDVYADTIAAWQAMIDQMLGDAE